MKLPLILRNFALSLSWLGIITSFTHTSPATPSFIGILCKGHLEMPLISANFHSHLFCPCCLSLSHPCHVHPQYPHHPCSHCLCHPQSCCPCPLCSCCPHYHFSIQTINTHTYISIHTSPYKLKIS